MSRAGLLNRPPTPDSDDDANNQGVVLTFEEELDLKLRTSGEKERLRQLLKKELEECGWVDAVTQKCKEVAASKPADKLTAEQLVADIRQFGRQRVPDHIKAELLQRIKSALAS